MAVAVQHWIYGMVYDFTSYVLSIFTCRATSGVRFVTSLVGMMLSQWLSIVSSISSSKESSLMLSAQRSVL
jgi:hypothetical protein